MMSLVSRLKNWVTGADLDDEYLIDDEFEPVRHTQHPIDEDDQDMERTAIRRQKKLKVVDHPNTQTTQVIVIEPKAFEESLEIVEHLRSRKAVILNLHLLDTAQSQRVVDFLSGATHAIDGNQQRIGDGVFIFTPMSVEISTDMNAMGGAAAGFTTEAYWNQNRPKF